jgi:heme/copper-type cytochrome/quinol oxidase subunit 2
MTAHLHSLTLWLCAAGAAFVFGVMIHSVATFRRRPDIDTGEGAGRSRLTTVIAEVLWAIVPIAIMAASATPAMRTAMTSPSASVRYAQSETSLSITAAASYNADRK